MVFFSDRARVARLCLGLGLILGISPAGCSSDTHAPSAVRRAVGSTSHALTVTPIPAGSLWERESSHAVRWDSPGLDNDDLVIIHVSFDSGATWEDLGTVAAVNREWIWTVPASGPSRARLRVTRMSGAAEPVVLGQSETDDVPLAPSQKRSYTWARILSDAPWGPRDGAGALVHDGKMWLIGGWNGDRFPLTTANDVWSSTNGVNWSEEKPNTFLDPATFDRANDWEGRHFSGYQVHDGKMWLIGGDPMQGHYQTDVWNSVDGRRWTRTDIHTSTPRMILDNNEGSETFGEMIPYLGWRPVEEAQFGLRTIHITGVFDGKLWLMGGQRIEMRVSSPWPGAPAQVFNDVWSSTDGATWTETPTVGPMWAPRGLVDNAVSFNGRMWLIGGGTYEDPGVGIEWRDFYNDVWSTADGAHWEKVPELAPFKAREYHNVAVFDGRLWVIGGYDTDNSGEAWYTTDGRNWYNGSKADFAPRHAASVWVYNGDMYIGAGNTFEAGVWVADMWKVSVAP